MRPWETVDTPTSRPGCTKSRSAALWMESPGCCKTSCATNGLRSHFKPSVKLLTWVLRWRHCMPLPLAVIQSTWRNNWKLSKGDNLLLNLFTAHAALPLKKHNHIVGKLCGLHSHHWHVAFLTTPFNLITSESQSDARCGFMYFFTPDYACWPSLELDTCWIFEVMPVDTLSDAKKRSSGE